MRLALLAMKGGVGKTTTSAALGLAFAREGGRVLLVDCDDPQWSLTGWHADAVDSGQPWPENLTVQRWSSSLTRSSLAQWDHVVFDLGPKRPEMARSVLRLADTALIPTAPRRLDFAELEAARALIASAQVRQPLEYAVLLTMVRLGTKTARASRTALTDELELPVLETVIPLAEAYAEMAGRVPVKLGAYADLAADLLAGVLDAEDEDAADAS